MELVKVEGSFNGARKKERVRLMELGKGEGSFNGASKSIGFV